MSSSSYHMPPGLLSLEGMASPFDTGDFLRTGANETAQSHEIDMREGNAAYAAELNEPRLQENGYMQGQKDFYSAEWLRRYFSRQRLMRMHPEFQFMMRVAGYANLRSVEALFMPDALDEYARRLVQRHVVEEQTRDQMLGKEKEALDVIGTLRERADADNRCALKLTSAMDAATAEKNVLPAFAARASVDVALKGVLRHTLYPRSAARYVNPLTDQLTQDVTDDFGDMRPLVTYAARVMGGDGGVKAEGTMLDVMSAMQQAIATSTNAAIKAYSKKNDPVDFRFVFYATLFEALRLKTIVQSNRYVDSVTRDATRGALLKHGVPQKSAYTATDGRDGARELLRDIMRVLDEMANTTNAQPGAAAATKLASDILRCDKMSFAVYSAVKCLQAKWMGYERVTDLVQQESNNNNTNDPVVCALEGGDGSVQLPPPVENEDASRRRRQRRANDDGFFNTFDDDEDIFLGTATPDETVLQKLRVAYNQPRSEDYRRFLIHVMSALARAGCMFYHVTLYNDFEVRRLLRKAAHRNSGDDDDVDCPLLVIHGAEFLSESERCAILDVCAGGGDYKTPVANVDPVVNKDYDALRAFMQMAFVAYASFASIVDTANGESFRELNALQAAKKEPSVWLDVRFANVSVNLCSSARNVFRARLTPFEAKGEIATLMAAVQLLGAHRMVLALNALFHGASEEMSLDVADAAR